VKVQPDLPQADGLPGTGNPTAVVAVARSGQFYYENQVIAEPELKLRLHALAEKAKLRGAQLTLVVLADKSVPNDTLVRLAELARQSGINELLQATRPRLTPQPSITPAP